MREQALRDEWGHTVAGLAAEPVTRSDTANRLVWPSRV
jgi:hypothetical protein